MKRLFLMTAAIGLLLTLTSVVKVSANGNDRDDDNQIEAQRIQRGFAIAPVPLDLQGKNRELVGLGSYLVNAVAACNDCHTNPPFAPGGNPFVGQPKRFNTAHYLGGGMAFGPFISRNLTPENGLPAGRNFDQFVQIMRHGTDFDQLHPQLPLLQVMPWPVFSKMSDHDIEAIYEYLSAIPCIDNTTSQPPAGAPNELRNDCGN